MDRRTFLTTGLLGAAVVAARPGRAVADPPAFAGLSGPVRQEIAKLVDAARSEGKVVIYAPASLGENFGRGFRAYFGLPDSFAVEEAIYKTADLQGRVETELRAGKLAGDFIRFPIGPWVFGLKAKGLLLEWQNPEEKAYATIHAEPAYWVPTMWAPVIIWNPQKVQDTLDSWRDLANPKYSGRVAIGDASKSAGWTQYFYVLSTRLSEKYFEDLSRVKPGFIVSSETLVEAAVSGEYPIVVSTSFSAYRVVAQKKVDLRVAYPKDGIVPVVDAFFTFKSSPHPAAGRLARMFHASREGQQQLMREGGYLSFRPDIESPNEKLLPPITKLNVIPFDYRKVSQKELDQFRKRFITVFNL
ncbi:MAG: extracellular solute-binding protein [Candidatus Rokubacteria bacterium]|nr:extracellular solute-binding protein [Candidatus Rokubacteria bacterium]